LEAKLSDDAHVEPHSLRELGLVLENLRRLRADRLAAFGMPCDADRPKTVLIEQPGLEHLEAAVEACVRRCFVASDHERLGHAAFGHRLERPSQLVAALELAR